jgi:predicted O-methyltransferase YrrM
MSKIKTQGLFSYDDKVTLTPIHLRNTPPPDETLNHIEFIKWLSHWLKPSHYLELGVREGMCFHQIIPNAEYSTGVDIEPCSDPLTQWIKNNQVSHKVNYYKGTTDEYFSSLSKDTVFDLVFIDADHSYESVLKDFLNVKDKVIKNGFVILHDTYPYTKEFMETKVRGECYKVPMYIKENLHPEWEVVTLPFNPGLTILKKSPGSNIWEC